MGKTGLRPEHAISVSGQEVIAEVQKHILPIERNVFRTTAQVNTSQQQLDALWQEQGGYLGGRNASEWVSARESAVLLLDARMVFLAASQRLETRGLHRLKEYPNSDTQQNHHIVLQGLHQLKWHKTHTLDHLPANLVIA